MSSTRKKLSRLFKAPTDAGDESFAPRDLERTPREFDADGIPVASEAPAPRTANVHQPPATSSVNQAGSAKQAPASTGAASSQAHAIHTAPWAAGAAFASWKAQRGKTPTKPRKQAASTPPKSASPIEAKHAPSESIAASRHAKNTAPAISPHAAQRAHEVPPGHVHRMDGASSSGHRVGMRAAQEFATWKAAQNAPSGATSNPTPSIENSTTQARTKTVRAATHRAQPATPDPTPRSTEPTSTIDVPHDDELAQTSMSQAATPAAPSRPLPKDRVRRRAIRSLEARRPQHRKQSTAGDGANNAPPPPSKAGAVEQAEAPPAQVSMPLRAEKQPIQATAHTPAERLMWISAHRDEISEAHVVSTLRALEGSGLRGGHEARRLRMLAEALLRLQENEAALETLEALQKMVPHDAWTLLRLAETCAERGDTLEAGLAWCEDLLRLHPWLSQAKEIHARISDRLARLN